MGSYHNDQPISGEEESPDLLSRKSFSERLASVLLVAPGDDCMTVSLEGDWGYGKTSVINLVKKTLSQQENSPVIVEYNPWLAGKAEALVQDFLVQFSAQLNIPDRPKEGLRASKELLAYSKLFNVMKFIPGVEPWASTVQGVFGAVGGATKKISKLKELDLLGRKKKINALLKSLGVSIVVVIDDIDRLAPDEAFQVIRLVKAVADFPGTSFLLSFDPSYLASSLEKQGIDNSSQYIDKVVQLRIPLPLIAHRDLQNLADIELRNLSDKSLTDSFERDQERLSYLYHRYAKHIIRSPRELKRIFNHLRFVLAQTEGKVCFTDLYCLSILAIKSHGVYESIKSSPEFYVGQKFGGDLFFESREKVIEKSKEERESILTNYPEKDAPYIRGILKELFPLLDDVGYSMYGTDYDQCGRVASEKRLYTALHYQVPPGLVSDTEIVSFLTGAIDREEYLREAISEDFVERLFELLNHNIDKAEYDDATLSLKAIYNVFLDSEYLKVFEDRVHGFFGFDPYRNVMWLTFSVIEKTENKEVLLFELLEDRQALPITADVVRRLLLQLGKIETDDPRLKQEQWLSEEKSEKYIDRWSDLVMYQLLEGSLVDSIHASHVYFVFRRASKEKAEQVFSRWLSEESGLEKVAKLIGRCGSDSTNGPYAEISEESLSGLLDYQLLRKLAGKKIKGSGGNLSAYFKAVYKSILTGEKYYLNDASKGEGF
ncbi:KAP family P-loop domain protein [Halomonas sp. THAF12]|uniref:KAP family P-loop NTPase fold protein n=1 Tax=Halomonas sp. THAF12 TaxID=2587849 RepID=UPI001268C431|nr:P-loop NTPase fold protein [Halomonas sp. THAF12]QFT83862.1 KAP family P-loop domain protein [Halomonas sp. THAF12]